MPLERRMAMPQASTHPKLSASPANVNVSYHTVSCVVHAGGMPQVGPAGTHPRLPVLPQAANLNFSYHTSLAR
jgi:hypothetical protein